MDTVGLWVPVVPLLTHKLDDGSTSTPSDIVLMRRRIKGSWRYVYRRPTPDELQEFNDASVW